jgi:hypothetical protein
MKIGFESSKLSFIMVHFVSLALRIVGYSAGGRLLTVKTRKDFRTINVQWNRQWCLFCPSGHTKNQ